MGCNGKTRKDAPPDTNNKVDFRLGRNVEVTIRPGETLEANFFPLLCQIILHVRLGTLENNLSFGFCCLTIKIEFFHWKNRVATRDIEVKVRPERWLIKGNIVGILQLAIIQQKSYPSFKRCNVQEVGMRMMDSLCVRSQQRQASPPGPFHFACVSWGESPGLQSPVIFNPHWLILWRY